MKDRSQRISLPHFEALAKAWERPPEVVESKDVGQGKLSKLSTLNLSASTRSPRDQLKAAVAEFLRQKRGG